MVASIPTKFTKKNTKNNLVKKIKNEGGKILFFVNEANIFADFFLLSICAFF